MWYDPQLHYGVAVTPNDSNENVRNARFLMNTGTAGAFTVRQNASGGHMAASTATATYYLVQGGVMPLPSSSLGVNTTGLGAGVTLVAFY